MSTATDAKAALDVVPVTDEAMIDRPRLLALLGAVRPGHVTLITGPAGSGKSVLAEQWLAAQGDIELVRVASRGDAGNRTAPSPSVLAAVGSIERGVLFVDAIDSVDSAEPPRHGSPVSALVDLVDRAPATVHVLVTCRSPWRDRVARLRARGRGVIRVDEDALAFTSDEIARFVKARAGDDAGEQAVAELHERTGGWPVALQLLHDVKGPAVDADAADRRLAAYFEEHVLDRQSDRVRRFLRHSSVVAELNGSLCGAITGDPAARALLQLVEQRGDFVRCADDEANRYLWHPHFRAVLRRELRVREPGVEEQLLLRAAAWHAKRGEAADAVPLLIEAEAWDQLIRLVDRFGRRIFEEGRAAEALTWLQRIPAGWEGEGNGHALQLAYLHTMLGQTRVAEQLVHDLEGGPITRGEAIAAQALRATWAFYDAPPEMVLPAADAVRAALAARDRDIPDVLGLTSRDSVAVMADAARARTRWHVGDIAGARRELLQITHRPNVYTPWLLHAMGTLALLEAWAGEFRLSQQHARQLLRVAATAGLTEHPTTIDARLALAHVTRERGGQGGAEAFLDSAATILEEQRRPVAAAVLAVERGLWHLAAGNPERGLEVLVAVRNAGEPPPPPLIAARLAATEARLLVAGGDRERARLVLDGAGPARIPELSAVTVQLAVADGDLDRARAELEGWVPVDGSPRARLERDLWGAIVELSRGSRRQALQHGLALLGAAEPEGHLRMFLDAGRPGDRLLQALVNVAGTPYAVGIVGAAQATSGARLGGAPFGLTERELAVARYLPTPLSSAEIAAQLYISRNTLKTHLQTVYRKLGVSGRQEAIRRAKDLGLA